MENLTTEDIIPIDDHLLFFKEHIDSNDRAIFSARFGDGKTFFLDKFKEEFKEDYEFITLYPVNYQVAENKDIFEYIKRDVLMQLFTIVGLDDSEASKELMIWGYLKEHGTTLLGDILKVIPGLTIASAVFDLFKNHIEKFNKIKDSIKSESKHAEDYITSFNIGKGGIYEFDAISQLICHLNLQVKRIPSKKKNIFKKSVLIIEDLDRIDPAHIFRILNIFSAHFERPNTSPIESETTRCDNKYLFDKILLVCDHKNIENIFHHLYGAKTDFQGYIGKFSTIAPYDYSLKEHFKQYIINNLDTEISQFGNLSNAFAELVFARYLKDEDNSGNQERFKGIKEKLFIPSNFGNNHPDLTIPYTSAMDYSAPNLPDVKRKIPQNNRFAKFAYLLKRFKILEIFSEKYINEIPTDSRGTIDHNVPEILTTREFFKLIGECWLLAPHHGKGTVHAQHGKGVYLDLVENGSHLSRKINFKNIEVEIDNLFTHHSEDWIRQKMELLEVAKALTRTICPPNCY